MFPKDSKKGVKYPTSDSINTDTRLPADKQQSIRKGGI